MTDLELKDLVARFWLRMSSLLYDTTIPLLDIYWENHNSDACAPVLIAALFTKVRAWEQPKWPTTTECREKMWQLHAVEYYSATKRNEIGSFFRDVVGPRVCPTEWSKSEWEKQRSYVNAYMWNLEKRCRWNYFHGRTRDAGIENGQCGLRVGRRGEDELRELHWYIHTTMCKIESWWEPADHIRSSSIHLPLNGNACRNLK